MNIFRFFTVPMLTGIILGMAAALDAQTQFPNGKGFQPLLDKTWTHLCYAEGIGPSEKDLWAHSGDEFLRQLGAKWGTLVAPTMGDIWSTSLDATRGHLWQARIFMVQVATKYGYILTFSDGAKLDPGKIKGWKPQNWKIDEVAWASFKNPPKGSSKAITLPSTATGGRP